jgi:hypothetical protein
MKKERGEEERRRGSRDSTMKARRNPTCLHGVSIIMVTRNGKKRGEINTEMNIIQT